MAEHSEDELRAIQDLASTAPQQVRYELTRHVATLTIDRAERRNSISWIVVEQLVDSFRQAARDDDVRVVVLTGAGDRSFCSGGDMRDVGNAQRRDNHGHPPFARLLSIMHTFPKPVVGRINGDALGGGFGLALSCDLSVAAASARFGTPEIKLGLFPWMIMPLITAHVGPKKCAEMFLCGKRFDAAHALELELINEIAEDGALDERVEHWTRHLAEACPPVLRKAMVNMRARRYPSLPAVLAEQEDHFVWNLNQPHLMEGVSAFFQKRKPNWIPED